MRAVIEFTPKPTSNERLCAGVVVKADDGALHFVSAIDARKMEHAFGAAGVALADVARRLCESLVGHWAQNNSARDWTPPFSNARLSSLEPFSASSAEEACTRMLARTSTLHTLGEAYVLESQSRSSGIVERVRAAVRRDANAKHLAKRFNRHLTLAGEAQPLKVDFLGQRYACYFLQLTQSAKHIENSTERAYGKLFELQALKRLLTQPRKSLGLLEDERPVAFELLMVGNHQDAVQRRAIYQVEVLADRSDVVARVEGSAASAAERVSEQERLAA